MVCDFGVMIKKILPVLQLCKHTPYILLVSLWIYFYLIFIPPRNCFALRCVKKIPTFIFQMMYNLVDNHANLTAAVLKQYLDFFFSPSAKSFLKES